MKAEIVELEDGEAGLILPAEVLAALNLGEGDTVIIDAKPGLIEIRRPKSGADRDP